MDLNPIIMRDKQGNAQGPVTHSRYVHVDSNGKTLEQKLLEISSGGGSTSSNKYAGKTIMQFGDSITEGVGSGVSTARYPYYLGLNLGSTTINKGSSGGDHNRMRVIVCGGTSSGGFTYVEPDYTNVDYATIMIGHNGGVGASTINDISGITDFNLYPDTYYGNVCRSIEHIWNRKQSIKILLLTPIKSNNGVHGPNAVNATNALKTIGNFYSIPVIDLHNISGLNSKNMTLYTSDGHTHPNVEGSKMIADVLASQMLTY